MYMAIKLLSKRYLIILIYSNKNLVLNWTSISRKEEIIENRSRNKSNKDAEVYFDSMASYVDELRTLQKELRVKIRDYVNSNLLDASHKEAYGIAILVLVLVVSPIIIILVHNAVATIQVRLMRLCQVANSLDPDKLVNKMFCNVFILIKNQICGLLSREPHRLTKHLEHDRMM